MGGHQKGEVASAIVGQTVLICTREGTPLSQAVKKAHHAVLDSIRRGEGAPGMGSTVVALRLQEQRYEIAWVGDSRAYLWDGRTLRSLTRDHSFVQQLIDYGAISEQEARTHPHKNIITRAIGFAATPLQPKNPDIAVDSISGTLKLGEQLLLCSDGLTSEVGKDEIQEVLSAQQDPQAAVDELIQRALKHGGSDNVTVILVGVVGG
jgi:protein phosphatase